MRNKTIAQYYENNKQKNLHVNKSKQWYKRKIILIPIAISLFLFFFAFPSPGNALAENIYKTVIQWFGEALRNDTAHMLKRLLPDLKRMSKPPDRVVS
jgi:hypothetical protein